MSGPQAHLGALGGEDARGQPERLAHVGRRRALEERRVEALGGARFVEAIALVLPDELELEREHAPEVDRTQEGLEGFFSPCLFIDEDLDVLFIFDHLVLADILTDLAITR